MIQPSYTDSGKERSLPAQPIENISLPSTQRLLAAFFDLDGTIVDERNGITAPSRQALATLHAAGVRVGIATGRPYFGAKQHADMVRPSAPSMYFSGALITHPDGTTLWECALGQAAVGTLIEICKAQGLYLELYTKDGYFVSHRTHISGFHQHYLGVMADEADLAVLAERETILKAVVVTDTQQDAEKLRAVADSDTGTSFVVSTGAAHPQVLFGNATAPRATRENALAVLLGSLSLSPLNVAAFGDAEADLAFMRSVAFGIAMANAPETVRRAVPYTTKSLQEEGVAYAVNALRPYYS